MAVTGLGRPHRDSLFYRWRSRWHSCLRLAWQIFRSSNKTDHLALPFGIELDLTLLGILLIGVVSGSAVGPTVSKYIPENGLRGLLGVVLVFIGLRYTGLV